jgi:hypothetical protein
MSILIICEMYLVYCVVSNTKWYEPRDHVVSQPTRKDINCKRKTPTQQILIPEQEA